jgi:hypothetical protein
MTKPGPSPEYRDLLNGRISPDEYVQKVKKEVNKRIGVHPTPQTIERSTERRAAAAG